jgi:Fe-S-cluster containining protein
MPSPEHPEESASAKTFHLDSAETGSDNAEATSVQGTGDDSDNGVWYRSGLAFECTGCGNCCSGPGQGFVWIQDEEIARMATALGIEDIDAFERQFVRRIGIRKSLVEYADGDCIFLDPQSRRCMVYEARPVQCRTWPFWESNLTSPKAWARAAKDCPGCNRGTLYSLGTIQRVLGGRGEASLDATP